MRRFFALAAAISVLALGTSASQLPFGQPHAGTGMKDPSFPQPGVMDLPGTDTAVGDAGRVANLADTLTLDRKAGLWWEYARDVSSTAKLLASSGKQTTLLVPVDSAIMKMTRKPHQNEDGTPANDQQAEDNVARFIAAHVVPGDVDMPTKTAVPTLLDGLCIEISGEEGDWRVQPGNVEVLAVKSASNGKILYINQVLLA